MDATSPRWQQVTTSHHAWEAEALEALRVLLPDAGPFRAWTNFQFTNGGRIHEVDALVITPKGGFVIEVKSWSGGLDGDQGTWTQTRRDGSRLSVPNPANLTAEKTRELAGLVRKAWSHGPHRTGPGPLYLTPLVWLSNPALRVRLPFELRQWVALADGSEHRWFPTITDAILTIGADQAEAREFRRVSEEQSSRFAAAMLTIGIRASERRRTAGSYVLDLPAFAERDNAQDFTATHRHTRRRARVRIYSDLPGMANDQARALQDAANREYTAAVNLRRVDGVVEALDLDRTDFGPAVVFEHDDRWKRLDLFLAERDGPLPLAQSLDLVEALAGTLREVHKRRITHRMLTPQSVWLKTRSDGDTPLAVPLLTDFSLAASETATVGTTTAVHTRLGVLPVAGVSAVELVVSDRAMATYLAPESFTDPRPDGVALDVYSLGAIAYLLITGRPPAADRAGLRDALGQRGLSLSAVLPEVDPELELVVRRCTTPIVSQRFERMSDVLASLAVARAAVSGERHSARFDPTGAEPGDLLADRFEVLARLGKGSTALALRCHDRKLGREVVLKVSLGDSSDNRVRAESERLDGLDQANIVKLYELLELGGRPTLVLSVAGVRSLAQQLREEGPASPEDLQRWGDDLLEALRYLEKVGVWHRDIKPDNLGVGPLGKRKARHLVLFDFSLSGAHTSDTDAGTPPYLEPFLGADRPFDPAAERYAAAVTLHEMATGETPVWGDGRSDPAFLPPGVEATLLTEAMDESLRAPLAAFLARALRRNPAERFDTAEDMLRSWVAVFAGWEHPGGEGDDGDGNGNGNGGGDGDGDRDGGSGPGADGVTLSVPLVLPRNLSLDDPVTSLGRSKKVASALRKCGAATVREVAGLDAAVVNRTRGVSVKTRRDIVRLRALVLERFADDLGAPDPGPRVAATGGASSSPSAAGTASPDEPTTPTTAPTTAQAGTPTGTGSVGDTSSDTAPPEPTPPATANPGARPGAPGATGGATPLAAEPALAGRTTRVDLDSLGLCLLPPPKARGRTGKVAETVRALLGLGEVTSTGPTPATGSITDDLPISDDWPTATAVAAELGLTRAAVSQTQQKVRVHWGRSPELAGVLADVVAALADLGGVAGVSELAGRLLDVRDTGLDGIDARRLAGAVIRAAVEATPEAGNTGNTGNAGNTLNTGSVPADVVAVRRFGRRTLLALDGASISGHLQAQHPSFDGWRDSGTEWSGFDADGLLALAVALGRRADELVAESTLVTSSDVVPALRAVRTLAGRSLGDSRLVRLAAAASGEAVANSASDLVARGATAVDALRWSRPALIAANRLTTEMLVDRVAVRFPHVKLPFRPDLDAALAQAGLPLRWDDTSLAYVSTVGLVGAEQLTVAPGRANTAVSAGGRTLQPANPLDPAVGAALAVQHRLDAAATEGGFLALRVPTDRLADARNGLSRWTSGEHGLVEVDLEAVFLRHLRAEAERLKVVWSNVESADNPADSTWTRLSVLASVAVQATLDEVRAHRRVLAWFPGAIVRHGGDVRPGPLDQLREAATARDGELELLWLVVLGGQTEALPTVDGTPVPILSPGDWLEVTDPWLSNAHRSEGMTSVGDRLA